MDCSADKLSIKNLLFTKALPNYEIPTQIDGKRSQKIFSCTDCGDKFVFESSHKDHINRKSVLITYMCRHCGETKVFYNRCMLLFHIRSHSFKTATINVQDLKVEPLPISLYKQYASQVTPSTSTIQLDNSTSTIEQTTEIPKKADAFCVECMKLLPSIGFAHKVRACHYMQYTNEVYTCPICLFTLPTICGLRAHMRFHLKFPPYYCPECGIHIADKNMRYPFAHDCEGFNMMRATCRVKCPVPGKCPILHPTEFNRHMKTCHIKKVYKCPMCVVASFNEPTMLKHLLTHKNGINSESLIFYQCELCPGRLVLQIHIDNHLIIHSNTFIFPCWGCGTVFKEAFALVDHQMKKHDQYTDAVKKMFMSVILESENQTGTPKRLYRVVKRCDQCEKDFTYKCEFEDIESLPNECPQKCTSSNLRTSFSLDETESQLTCCLCDIKISYDWEEIKKHYALSHKNHRCLDAKVVIHKVDVKNHKTRNQTKITKRIRKKKQPQPQIKENATDASKTVDPISGNHCSMCEQICESKDMLETHFMSHRDPCMAYQCLECGQSFVVKPSFSKHLVLEHGIYDVEHYINNKPCYNATALDKHQTSDVPIGPLLENQCQICMDKFENSAELKKHFRVHGMAFLLKNTVKINENMSDKNAEDIHTIVL